MADPIGDGGVSYWVVQSGRVGVEEEVFVEFILFVANVLVISKDAHSEYRLLIKKIELKQIYNILSVTNIF
jgi:hypothetical protein